MSLKPFRNGPLLVWLAAAAGCRVGASPVAVKPGMTGQQVQAALGAPLVTGTYRDTRGAPPVVQERWTYRQGDGALVILMENGAVKQSAHQTDPVAAQEKKVHEGMTRAQVRAALGEPALGDNPKDPNPNPTWQYSDPVAPVSTLMVSFQGEKVSKVSAMPNMAYGTP